MPVENERWVIILAGGEGERMRSLTERWLGRHQPKQYCTFSGSRSMLEHTLDRAGGLVKEQRIVTVVGHGHGAFFDETKLAGPILEQPSRLDTAPGIFLPASYIMGADPSATVLILPSDHFVYPEDRLTANLEKAFQTAERLKDRLVLIGVSPDRPATDYGWVETAAGRALRAGPEAPPGQVTRFHEKPIQSQAERYFERGALWNTMIMSVHVRTLWSLGQRFFPRMMKRFESLIPLFRSRKPGELEGADRETFLRTFQNLRPANFSRSVLTRIPDMTVLTVMDDDILWSDWGRPERVVDSLSHIDKRPLFLSPSPGN